jgi:DNA modification methylase
MTNIFACELSSTIICGNSAELVKQLPEVDCVVTSPPYFQQRLYGTNSSELGRESSVGEYIRNLVDIFTAISLAPWGSVWVNIGDKRGKCGELLRIPHLFTTAMAEAGFLLVDEVVWAKESVQVNGQSVGHCMIEPAARRLNGNGHEPFYRFVRNPGLAWTDMSAVRIPRRNVEDVRYLPETLMRCHTSLEGRNLTNVWNVGAGKTKRSHYAVFDPALIERPVAMSCPLEITEGGPKTRVVEMVPYQEVRQVKRGIGKYTKPQEEIRSKSGRQDTGRQYVPRKPVTVGWKPDLPTIRRGVVLDPFCGTASAGEVSVKLGRCFIGIELYAEYVQIAEERCHNAQMVRRDYEAGIPSERAREASETSALMGYPSNDVPSVDTEHQPPLAW